MAAISERHRRAEAIGLIEVEYEPLPVLNDIDEALAPGSPAGPPGVARYETHPLLRRDGNIVAHSQITRGDVEAGFARADRDLRAQFTTQSVHQGYIEPRSGVAWVDATGRVTVSTSTQNPFNLRTTLAKVLQLPLNRVRVRSTFVGGGFGGKLDLGCEHYIALLALATGRPVRLIWTPRRGDDRGRAAHGRPDHGQDRRS